MIRFGNPEFWRFVVVGGVNTVLTYGIYAVLAMVAPYQVAYGVSYAAGICLSYLLNARFVFREEYSFKTFFRYPVVYLGQYVLGSFLLYLSVDLFSIDKFLAPIVIIVLTIPLTFLFCRLIIKRRVF